LAAPGDVVAGRKLNACGHNLLPIGDVAAQVTVADIDKDVGRELAVPVRIVVGPRPNVADATSPNGTVPPFGSAIRVSLAIDLGCDSLSAL
jgi:hypothetical protein